MSAGSVHWTRTEDPLTVPPTAVGASGARAGTTGSEANEGVWRPSDAVAVTTNVYARPFVRPDTSQVSADVVEQVKPPGAEDTV